MGQVRWVITLRVSFLTQLWVRELLFGEWLFLAMVWTVWRCWNKMVFHGNIFIEEDCFEFCKFDLAWWVKIEWGDRVPSVGNMIRCPGTLLFLVKVSKQWLCKPSVNGQINVNVEDLFREIR